MILPKYIGYVLGLLLLLQGLSCFGQNLKMPKARGFYSHPDRKGNIYWPQEKKDSVKKAGEKLADRKIEEAINNRSEILSFDSIYSYSYNLPKNICELTNLKELNLYGFSVRQRIDSSLKAKLEKCRVLYSYDKKIPDIIFCLSELEVLNFGLNPIAIVPEEIGQLQNLKKLYLNYTSMEHACHIEGIGTLQNLEFLDISDTQLDYLPKTISNLKKLQWLKMNNTSIQMWMNDIDWSGLTALEIFEARDSEGLGVSMRAIFMLPSLKKLYTDSSEVGFNIYGGPLKRSTLEVWSASSSNWKYLPDKILSKLPRLHTWNLSHNLLTYLPKKIGKLKSMESLDLSYNKLSKLPKSIKRLKKLKTLNLEGNPLDETTLDWLKSVLPSDCKLIF